MTPEDRRAYKRAYYAKRAKCPEFRKKNSETTRRNFLKRQAADPAVAERAAAQTKESMSRRANSPRRWLVRILAVAKYRAKKKTVPFNVDSSQVETPTTCPALGVPLTYLSREADPFGASLDRLVPSLGYVGGNVRVISRRANAMKNDGTLDEHRRLVAWMERELEPDRVLHTEGII